MITTDQIKAAIDRVEALYKYLNIEEKKAPRLAVGVGDEVVIKGGLFDGYQGTVQAISDDAKKITVLVKRGRRDMPVEFDAANVIPV